MYKSLGFFVCCSFMFLFCFEIVLNQKKKTVVFLNIIGFDYLILRKKNVVIIIIYNHNQKIITKIYN